jgi:hypothetical protein
MFGTATSNPAEVGNTPTSRGERPSTASLNTSARLSNPASAGSLAGLEPCTLITATEAGRSGLDAGTSNKIGGFPGCRWRASGKYLLDVSALDGRGLKDVVATGGVDTTVGKHKAKQTPNAAGSGSCAVVIGVSDSARVDVLIAPIGSAGDTCQVALQYAQLVESMLR